MNNLDAAALLSKIAASLDILGENKFKVRAYENAAKTIGGLEVHFGTYAEAGTLLDLPGIGKAIAEKLTELNKTGKIPYFEELRREVPDGIHEVMSLPGLGAKKARILWKELGITSGAQLEEAAKAGKIAGLAGFGERTQKKILEAIAGAGKNEGFYLTSQAWAVARELIAYLNPVVAGAAVAGSLRRGKSIVRDVDLLASADKPREVIEHFARGPAASEVIAKGGTKCSIRLFNGLQVDLRVVADDEYPAALLYFTGSKEHNIQLRARAVKRGWTLNEYGLFKGKNRLESDSEEALYKHLGLSYVPPELREGRGEVELAEEGKIPQLIDNKDITGILHVHSTWSDGTASIQDMAEKARRLGYKWMGLSDHSKAASYAHGLDDSRLKKQMKEVAAMNAKWKDFRILHGMEVDILPDGTLDLSDELSGKLDFVIGSIHSRFDMTESEMTERVCKVMASPHFDVLGHPTGRLLLRREGFKIDLEKVIQTAKKEGKVVELNANPHRLDLDDAHARRAKELGVKMSIDPDAHSVSGLEDVEFGLRTARRAGLQAGDVLNSLPAEKVKARFAGC
ncbi:MAG TPA: DNA polymerase/3'-5' exonuclease PolX [Planctomycetota bacterium]|nr:DNA polymerase/3'-5' exonuclease PolX [Planctomycetota bacterium]